MRRTRLHQRLQVQQTHYQANQKQRVTPHVRTSLKADLDKLGSTWHTRHEEPSNAYPSTRNLDPLGEVYQTSLNKPLKPHHIGPETRREHNHIHRKKHPLSYGECSHYQEQQQTIFCC